MCIIILINSLKTNYLRCKVQYLKKKLKEILKKVHTKDNNKNNYEKKKKLFLCRF